MKHKIRLFVVKLFKNDLRVFPGPKLFEIALSRLLSNILDWAVDHAPGAYTASFLASKSLSMRLQGRQEEDTPAHLPNNLLTTLTARFGEKQDVTVEQVETLSQKMMSYKVDKKNILCLKESLEQDGRVRDVARLTSLGLP